jgi:hypothetical protein
MPNIAKFTTSRSIVSLADRTPRQMNERPVHRTDLIMLAAVCRGIVLWVQ